MDMWKMEMYEIGEAEYEDMMEWLAYEADMATNPYDEHEPSEAELELMAQA